MKSLKIILAVDEEFGIGKDGGIPWSYPEDMKFFSKTTRTSTCVMGRHTYDSINKFSKGGSTLLPMRQCVVVSSTMEEVDNAKVVKKISEAIDIAEYENIFFIGGKQIYLDVLITLPNEIYVTLIPGSWDCDVIMDRFMSNVELFYKSEEVFPFEESELTYKKYTLV
jgi:dihydrofolate reductase